MQGITISKKEMQKIAKELFPTNYEVYKTKNPLYWTTAPKNVDRKTYHEIHFGYPGAVNIYRKYITSFEKFISEPIEPTL